MIARRPSSPRATTLVITLVTLTALAAMAAVALVRVMPRLRMAYQNAAWEEARLAAESGIDAAMGDLLRHAADPNGTSWGGWKQPSGAPATSAPGTSAAPNLITSLTAPVIGLLTGLLGIGPPSTTSPGVITSSPPIYLDNFKVSAATGVPTEVDIQLWALQSKSASHNQWFRIRSMATCALPSAAYEAPANLDAPLRRFSLRQVRSSLRRNDVGEPSSIRLPNVSRTVEVLVEPILPFELALWTKDAMTLSYTGAWNVDSYDSTDSHKSGANGVYPGRTSSRVQSNGNIANSRARPASDLFGPLIAANGTSVRGAVATNGGDDLSTEVHENVSGAIKLDPARIRDDFNREMNPVPRPSGVATLPPPANGFFLTGTPSAPKYYLVTGSLTSFRIIPSFGTAQGVLGRHDRTAIWNLSSPLIRSGQCHGRGATSTGILPSTSNLQLRPVEQQAAGPTHDHRRLQRHPAIAPGPR